ncbi:MAG TPA: bifunctional [glutamate--ammonia ligase]-adenylyl-L-tyrosine phosphorylase/[glutamate--ammonia-ligase] adenylyltransferase, partial [Polyangiaceae bacterium]|nr:bifunctional [glutamate--ammonia ligase]-adenylyl-L-tyrosine phosphorylase/[glutamate--ammonia-ligase] adenylyltransferase [Polyangiaceae bacterium]
SDELTRDFGTAPAHAASVLLGAAFPPLTPIHGWQQEALQRMPIARIGRKRSRRGMFAAFERAVDFESPQFGQQLRRVAWIEKARIALRELLPGRLGGPDVDETARELSHLADASLEFALREAERAVRARHGAPVRHDGGDSRIVLFGMGKLGGQELNAGSDIDIIFAYDTDEGQSAVSLHEHWNAVAQRVVATIDAHDEGGPIFRVDLRLRPEGSQGALVNSVTAMERYYETWGRAWERVVWLRGRPCAGDFELGVRLEQELITPFVFPHAVDPAIATVLAELIERTRAEGGRETKSDLKIGIGGIREAEFFVQSLQLIWGGTEPRLRGANTLRALARLCSRGFATDREAEELEQGYLLLRRVEHRVQWASGMQTHRLPADAAERERLARSMGYTNAEQLVTALDEARSRVHQLFVSVLPSAPRPPSPYARFIASLEGSGTPPPPDVVASSEQSSELYEHLRALARRPDGLLGSLTRDQFPRLTDAVLAAIHESSDPVQSASYLRRYFGRLVSASALIRHLGDDPAALARFANILGASAFVGDALMIRPDLADIILFGAVQLPQVSPREIMAQELAVMQRSLSTDADPIEVRDEFMAALRRAKGKVMVDVAAADLAGLLEPRETTRLLSELADETLEQAVRFVLAGNTHGLAVIAMGKLGGQDIGYGSDLDVLFAYDPAAAPEGSFAPTHFTQIAQHVIRVISEAHWSGPGYELDTRLRPSGSKGLLVTSLQAFARYHRVPLADAPVDENEPLVFTSGAAWERQALLRARFAAGDTELGRKFIEVAYRAAYDQGAPAAEELHYLRMRMQHELGRERRERYDLKIGFGGLLDVEFACQWLQMKHGADPSVRTTDSLDALAALYNGGYLEDDLYRTLRDGYMFLRLLEQRIRVARGTGTTVIDVREPGLEQLARRMGVHSMPGATGAELLITRYRAVTASVRAAYLSVLDLHTSESPS